VAPINESVASFLNALTSGLQDFLSQAGPEKATVSWSAKEEESTRPGMLWWWSGLSVDPESRFAAGASEQTWEELRRAAESSGDEAQKDRFAALPAVLQGAVRARFGSEAECTDAGPAEEPPGDWTSVVVRVSLGKRPCPPLEFRLNPQLVTALGGNNELSQATTSLANPGSGVGGNPFDRLLHVEVPVSVSLGRTQMRMKDLLALSHGSIVELDQELSDEVEIRVSNCLIARGEVVAVDGNYGVRILKMVSSGSGPIPEHAASQRGGAVTMESN
jgi:flagellar motor switch protein FliN/FliY